jgi:2-polyprenyl-3-methyl-5-hydroxy-6-metoxy-1,4-benzoquinol methylase
MSELSERQLREKKYYEQYANMFDTNQTIDFSPIEGPLFEKERRPWNSYWRTYELAVDTYIQKKETGKLSLLDFGCGPGDNSLRFNRIGYNVTGFDISETNVANCKKLFEKNNVTSPNSFFVSTAEDIKLPANSFDIVVGIDILHHVDIKKAMREIKKLLKPDGIAVFREPVEVSFLDWIRNTKLIKALVPNSVSLEHHITEDERKLNYRDFSDIQNIFPAMKIERTLILSRLDRFIRNEKSQGPSILERIDFILMKFIPGFSLLGGGAVIILKK